MNKKLIEYVKNKEFKYCFIFSLFTGINRDRWNEIIEGRSQATRKELRYIAAYFYIYIELIRG